MHSVSLSVSDLVFVLLRHGNSTARECVILVNESAGLRYFVLEFSFMIEYNLCETVSHILFHFWFRFLCDMEKSQ